MKVAVEMKVQSSETRKEGVDRPEMRSSDFGRMRLEDVRWGNHQKLSLVMVMEEEVGKSSGGVNSAEKMFKPECRGAVPQNIAEVPLLQMNRGAVLAAVQGSRI